MSKGPRNRFDDSASHHSDAFDPAELQRRAISGTFWTVLHTVLAVPLAFVVNAVVARLLGPVEYGNLALLTLALVIATTVGNLGVDGATIQWGAAAAARGDRGTVGFLLSRNLGFHLLVQTPLLVSVVALLGSTAGLVPAGALIVGLIASNALGSAALLFGIEHRTASGAKIAMVMNLCVQLAILGAALLTHDPAWVWVVRELAAVVLLPLNFLVLDRWGRRVARTTALPRGFPSGFWRYSVPTMAAGLVGMLVFSRSEILFLNWLGDANAVGLFALAFGVAAQLTAPVDAILGPLLPAVSGLVNNHPAEVRAGRDRALRASSFLSGALLAGVVPTLTSALPLIYGPEYEGSRYIFFVLAATSTLQSACNPLIAFFSARRQAYRLLRINFAALTLDVVLAISLIPILGIAGALIANAGAQVVVLTLLVVMEARREMEPVYLLLKSLDAWALGLLAASTAAIATALLDVGSALSLTIASPLSMGLFIIMLRYTTTGMRAADWRALMASLPKPLRPLAHYGAWLVRAE
jgi:O-antigen/teichoic acid export membrane protein